MPYLPNKKFILGLLALLVLGGGFLVIKNQKKEQKQPISQELSVSKPAIAEEIDKDSDNDGLKDWEETLWGTDPNNPDTDGDGTPDGQEIKQGRNPLVAGPNDKIQQPKPSQSIENFLSQQSSETSLTESLAKNLLNDYLFVKQQNGDVALNNEDATAISDSLIESLNNPENKNNTYTISDIKISSNDDENSSKEYGNNLALIIKKYFDPLPETEMTVLKNSLEADNKAGLKKLEQIAAAYRNSAKSISLLKTPASFSDSHLNLINYFNNIAGEIDALQKSYDDPVQALLALKQYQTDSTAAYEILRSLNDYFLNKKVVFENNEPGELFKSYQ